MFFKSDVNSCKINNLEKKECGKGEGENISVCKLFKQRMVFILQVLYDYFKMEAKEEVFDKNFVQNPFVEKTWFDFNVKLPVCDLDCS